MPSSPVPSRSRCPGPAIAACGPKPLELPLPVSFHAAAKAPLLNANAVLSHQKPFPHFRFLQDASLTHQQSIKGPALCAHWLVSSALNPIRSRCHSTPEQSSAVWTTSDVPPPASSPVHIPVLAANAPSPWPFRFHCVLPAGAYGSPLPETPLSSFLPSCRVSYLALLGRS